MSIERIGGTLEGKVVSLFTRKPPATFAAVREVEAYWEALRGSRSMPARAEIDPRGISGALEYAFLLERIAPGAGRIRLAGTHLSDLMGMEVRGMPLTALFQPSARQTVADALEQVLQRPSVMTLAIEGERGIGRGKLIGQMLLCPLKSDLGDPSRVLGCLQTDGTIGRAPRRFDVVGSTERPIVERDLDPAPAPLSTPVQPAPVDAAAAGLPPRGLSDAATPYDAGPAETQASRPRPHLRLIRTDSDMDPTSRR
ncbi:MAG: PAS domain-containing protein [Rhodobacteraceae bacterium]|jgi:hypothetical protein|nr:PAS domain-containing protein [Paracoccaceae bacterium]